MVDWKIIDCRTRKSEICPRYIEYTETVYPSFTDLSAEEMAQTSNIPNGSPSLVRLFMSSGKVANMTNEVSAPDMPSLFFYQKYIAQHITLSSSDVLCDFGCGSRAVILSYLSQNSNLKKLMGIEIDIPTIFTAKYLLERSPKQTVPIELYWDNAAYFTAIDEVTIAYFFLPFWGKTLDAVCENISRSLQRTPRYFQLIFATCNEDIAKRLNAINSHYKASWISPPHKIYYLQFNQHLREI